MLPMDDNFQRRRQDFGSGGGILGGRPRSGSGERSPSDPIRGRGFGKFLLILSRNFWKILKISKKKFSRKLQKMDYFRRFFKK